VPAAASKSKPTKKTSSESQTPPPKAPALGAASIGTNLVPYALHFRYGYFQGPDQIHLEKYENAMRKDPILNRAIRFIALTMISSIGPFVHEDRRAMDFVREMRDTMDGNLENELEQLIVSGLWGGVGVSECTYVARNAKVWLKSMHNYHPRSIKIVPDDHGRLVDGANLRFPPEPQFRVSGIYQELPSRRMLAMRDGRRTFVGNHVKLPMNKIVYVAHNKRHGNHAGESAFAPCWIFYQMILETLQNLMITTERYGSPQIAAIVPQAPTNELNTPGDINSGYKSVADKAIEALSNMTARTGMVFEEPAGGNMGATEKIRLQVLSSFNNFGDNFWTTIMKLYQLVLVGLGVPPLLFLEHNGGLGAGAIAQVHADTYKEYLLALRTEFLEPFTEQVIGRLLKLNFDIDDPGHFEFNPFDLAAADTLMKVFGQATEMGYLHPDQEEDFHSVRGRLGLRTASKDSMPARMAANTKLLEAMRDPEKGKRDVAKIRNSGAEKTANIAAAAQVAAVDKQTAAQKAVAKLQAEKAASQPAIPPKPVAKKR
jgi:hypothetical protein